MNSSDRIFLSHCSVSPLHPVASAAAKEFIDAHHCGGLPELFPLFAKARINFTSAFARLLQTQPENISAVVSTAAACNMIALDYPLAAKDEILVYAHEYPSNYLPWQIAAERAGAQLVRIPDIHADPQKPHSFRIEDIEKLASPRTRLLCLSHVQFSNGFCCDIEKIASFCKDKQIDFILDATQSVGALPVFPEKLGISAVISSGWKWLLGPHGIGMMYSSPELREKLRYSHGGPEMMQQGYADLLDLRWTPHTDGRRFEFSTVPGAYVYALAKVVSDVFNAEGIESIATRLHDMQKRFAEGLNDSFQIHQPAQGMSSPILAFNSKKIDAATVCSLMEEQGVFLTTRGGYVRFAPHFTTSEQAIATTLERLNSLSV